jgi:hypothetical protein
MYSRFDLINSMYWRLNWNIARSFFTSVAKKKTASLYIAVNL